MLMNVNADGSGWLEILTFEQYYVNGPLSVNKDAGEWKTHPYRAQAKLNDTSKL